MRQSSKDAREAAETNAVAEMKRRAEMQRAKTERLKKLRLERDAQAAAAAAAAPPRPRPAKKPGGK